MRKNPTQAEKLLWQKLRAKQVAGLRFRRQHPIGSFIVDFYCAESRLVIEVDGLIHDRPGYDEHDIQRQEFLEGLGLRVIRFTNAEVLNSTDSVLSKIIESVSDSAPPP